MNNSIGKDPNGSHTTKGKVEVVTQGCRLNAFESEVIRKHALESGSLKDTIIINTCAVTAEAERQARQAVRRARRENPEAEIVVTGCAAQIDPDRFAAMPEADRIVGNVEKMEATTWNPMRNDQARISVNDI
ncbi:MAG: tRNA (N(6)-L-threonylcarbamoyladenosine(37)-C(2))-methylthiotransferase MtaB, partial [Alphaproteobacteria bacterium]